MRKSHKMSEIENRKIMFLLLLFALQRVCLCLIRIVFSAGKTKKVIVDNDDVENEI